MRTCIRTGISYHQCPIFVPVGLGDGKIIGVPVGVIVPPGVGETEGVVDGVLVDDGTAVLVAVGDTKIAVKKAGEVRLHVWPEGLVNVI